jgi:isopentenyl diphosphate isomerase/L-lactate dehydrogenase-like FMN-dependent dehydrogenase
MATELEVDISRLFSVEEFEPIAREVMSPAGYNFVSGAAGSGKAQVANREAYQRWVFRPRVLVDVSTIDVSTTLLGQRIELPVVFAPSALHKLAHPEGEIATARAAEQLGTLMIVSTSASMTVEDIAPYVSRRWFQLYWFTDREFTRDLVARAEAAGYQALCLTVDTPVAAWREHEARLPVLPHPGVEAAMIPEVDDLVGESSLTWSSLEWLRSITKLPIITKGVMTAEDARAAVDTGLKAIVVSNHGGRQLDSVWPTIRVLPHVVKAVGDRTDVLMDGGIRRGSDVVKALCLGAKGVLIGRAYAYALGAAGGPGVSQALEILRTDIYRTMKLLGCPSVKDLDRSYVSCDRW